jgi:hypothetical protein
MKDMLLKIAAVSAVAMLSACDSDSTVATQASPVEDSTLALQVLSARGDTLLAPPDSEKIVVDATPTKPIPPEPLVIPNSRATVATIATAPTPRVAPAQPAAADQPTKESSRIRTTEATVASATVHPVVAKRRAAEARENVERIRGGVSTRGTVSAGSSMSFAAGHRVCTANEGDTFEAVLLEPVRGSNGVEIPRGALAVAQITSLGEWGAGMGVKVKSVRFKGHTYPLSSDVGYVALERRKSRGAACIPDRGRIDASLTHPLTVLAYN